MGYIVVRLCSPEYPPPLRIGTFHGGFRNFKYDQQRIPNPLELELLMEDLETLNMTSTEYHPSPTEMEFLMEDFVWWTGVLILLLYPLRIPSHFTSCIAPKMLGCHPKYHNFLGATTGIASWETQLLMSQKRVKRIEKVWKMWLKQGLNQQGDISLLEFFNANIANSVCW